MGTKNKKRKVKVVIKQKALIQKKDKTNVVKPDTTKYPRMAVQTPRSLAPTFKIKIKKKDS